MFFRYVLLLNWLLSGAGCIPVFAQQSSVADQNEYVSDFPEISSARLNIARGHFGFSLKSKIDDKKAVVYLPNVQGRYGIEFYYRKLGVELSLGLPTTDREIALFGNTRSWDFQVNLYRKKFGYDLSLQWYKGFYLANPSDFDSQWNVVGGYPQLPGLTTFHIGANAYHVFNNNRFSFQAAFNQAERQVKSAGSFLLMGSAFHTRIRGDSSLFPTPGLADLKQGIRFRQGYFNTLSLAPGYAYTYVFKKDYYVSASLFWGLSVRQQMYDIDDERKGGVGLGHKVNFRIAAGYYGNKVFAGFHLIWDNNRMGLENVRLSTSSVDIRLFVGYRFSRIFGRRIQNDKLDKIILKPK
jgi:hypothetical protein